MTYQTFQSWVSWEDAKKSITDRISAEWLSGLDLAFQFSLNYHRDDRRANGILMETHLVQVLQVVLEGLDTYHPGILAVVALHDLLEHTDCSAEEIYSEFGEEISTQVEWLTIPCKLKGDTSLECKQTYYHELQSAPETVKLLRLADRVSTAQHLRTFSPLRKQLCFMQETRMFHIPLAVPYQFFSKWFLGWQNSHQELMREDLM